jgi:archaellum component FlaC
MAGRTSTSVGMGVAVTILSLTTVGFFVAFAVYFGKHSDKARLLAQASDTNSEIIKDIERNRDDIRNLVADAKKNGNQSLVGYMLDSQQATMQLVTGTRREKASDLLAKMQAAGIENTTLMAKLNERAAEVSNLQSQLEQERSSKDKAIADLKNEVDRVTRLRDDHQKTVDALTAQFNTVKAEADTYRAGIEEYKKLLDAQRERQATEAAEKLKAAQDQLARSNEELLITKGQLADIRKQKSGEMFRSDDESALVDGTVLSTNPADRQAFVSIGSRQKVVLGMTFNVYSTKAAIQPNKDGGYPTGKALIEVVSVGENSATCRVVSEVKGNPVVKGDVIANPLYDPNKSYKFVVFGNFDANRDGISTANERDDISTMIQSWGGGVTDDLTGDVDFLVLGEKPMVPPRPSADSPLEVVQEYIRRQREVDRYDELYKRASSTSVPIISENRLYTLIAKEPRRAGR